MYSPMGQMTLSHALDPAHGLVFQSGSDLQASPAQPNWLAAPVKIDSHNLVYFPMLRQNKHAAEKFVSPALDISINRNPQFL